MSQIQLHVYPRGYLGQVLAVEPKRDKLRSQIVRDALVYDARIFHADTNVVLFDAEIEEMYTQFVSKTPEAYTAEFHARVLKKATEVFGTKNFCQWILFHKDMKTLTPTHIAYLEDTLRYVFEGKERKMIVGFWERILTLNSVVEPEEFKSWDDCEAYVRKMAGINVISNYHYDITSFISTWASRSFADLIYGMHLLFGKFE